MREHKSNQFHQSTRVREPKPIAGRVPPNDMDAEVAVLSACMLDEAALAQCQSMGLHADEFYFAAHKLIFGAMCELVAESKPVDLVTVGGHLRDREKLKNVGGASYLAQISDQVPFVSNIAAYCERVQGLAQRRRMISVCQQIAAEGYGDVGDEREWVDSAEQLVFEVAHANRNLGSVVRARTAVQELLEHLKRVSGAGGHIYGWSTGFSALDVLLGGLHPGDLTVVAGRPGMGKTAFMLALCDKVMCSPPRPGEDFSVATEFVSLEMPRDQLIGRMVAQRSGLNVQKFRSGLSNGDWPYAQPHFAHVFDCAAWLDDDPQIGLMELRARIRRLMPEVERTKFSDTQPRKLCVVAVDYLQLMKPSSRVKGNREQEISEISRGLKSIAKEFSIAVIVGAQLNRGVETRTGKDKRPKLADLRESGAIEQDADNVLMLFREDYYDPDTNRKGVTDVIVAKQRNGPTGTATLKWDGACNRFRDLYDDERELDWEESQRGR